MHGMDSQVGKSHTISPQKGSIIHKFLVTQQITGREQSINLCFRWCFCSISASVNPTRIENGIVTVLQFYDV